MAGESHFVKVFGVWRAPNPGDSNASYVKVFGVWRGNNPGDDNPKYVKVNGIWRETDTTPPGLPPGTYILSPTFQQIQNIPGGAALASFNTTVYQGRITAVRARVSWTQRGSMNSDVYGRHSNTFYRNIAADIQWANRTIDHRLDTFSGSVLPQFNSGSAIGYQLQVPGFSDVPSDFISALRLSLDIT